MAKTKRELRIEKLEAEKPTPKELIHEARVGSLYARHEQARTSGGYILRKVRK